ncbi:MAG: molybdopterin-dependent oxidoreductase, partial [Firmicutes bacterium]|nr:molybdopterin-dependent oxidoreductase [Bacillota bacterium]
RNIARPGDTTINQAPYEEYPMEEIMTKMRPLYEKALQEAKEASTPEKLRGVGVSFGGYACTSGGFDTGSIGLELAKDNTIIKYDTWQDMGQGGDIGSLMVTLEALKPLGITPDQVKLVQNDSKYCPDTGMSAGSRSHYMNGHATRLAAKQLLDAMRKPDGTYRTYAEMKAEGIETKYVASFQNNGYKPWLPMDANTGKGDIGPQNYGMFLAEVEVDTATGKATVIGFTAVDDVGVVGNITALNGQGYGGLSHCVGYALSEDYSDPQRHTNIKSCGIPCILDVPDKFELYHCENPRPYGPFGSVGASELYQSGGHVAILNAIYNACGIRIFNLPATADKIKAGLDTLASGGKIEPPEKYFLGSDLFDELDYLAANPV